jgi:site-specific DNA-methyltransferase (adenine-specific)/adenine-specific DNA-methyltransferase
MPTLDWIGKKAVEKHHEEVPYHLLRCDASLSVGDPGSGNLIVQGDNLLALKALLPYYAGKIKCIYIDPPYNTGNENWIYNDNVNSSEIREWLGRVVGSESEDLSRHDKWLCMMFPRIALLAQFLTEDGAIFVSIDDSEVQSLRAVMDEIFGRRNFVSQLTWFKRVSPANDAKHFSSDHEYIVVYAKHANDWSPGLLKRTAAQLDNYKNPDADSRGAWNSVTYTCNKTAEERPNLYHPIINPNTGETIWPKKTAVWKYDAERHARHVAEGLVYWGADGKAKMPRLKRFLHEMDDVVPRSVLHYDDWGHTQLARTELLEILENSPFTTPKPTKLITRLLSIGAPGKDALIMDSFAGSGTTGHAVLQLNKNDGGNRKFIQIEIDETICEQITAERMRRVIDGYVSSKGKSVEGIGGGFRFCTLSKEPLFDEQGQIQKDVSFSELARHVFFSETGEPLPKNNNGRSPLLGVANGTAVYLLYNGILGDKRSGSGNVLTREVLHDLPEHDGPKVIYGTGCRISKDRLIRERIEFRQIPYEVKVK